MKKKEENKKVKKYWWPKNEKEMTKIINLTTTSRTNKNEAQMTPLIE
jgi:hypothetical protein